MSAKNTQMDSPDGRRVEQKTDGEIIADGGTVGDKGPVDSHAAERIQSRHKNTYVQRIPDRAQKLMAGLLIWFFLALWTLGNFWDHIDKTIPDSAYKNLLRLGCCGAEVVLFFFVIWHVYNKHLRVRKTALICGTILGVFLLAHSGTLRSIEAAHKENEASQKAMAEGAAKIVGANSSAAAEQATKTQLALRDRGVSQRERMAAARDLRAGANKSAKEVADGFKSVIEDGKKNVEQSSLFPDWYVREYMYIGVFSLALILLLIVLYIWMTSGIEDVDENFDGIPDVKQPNLFPQYAGYAGK